MPYLAINNYTVPVREASTGFKEAGTRGYNQANRYFLNRAGRDKREWKFETAPLSNDDAQGLIGMLQMRGEHFLYGTQFPYALNGPSPYSQKGYAYTGTPLSVVVGNHADDGALVYTRGGALAAPYSAWSGGSLHSGVGTTNMLTVNNAFPTANGHLSNISGATHAANTTHQWASPGCVSVTTIDQAGESGVSSSGVTVAGSTTYQGSLYIKSSASAAGKVGRLNLFSTPSGTENNYSFNLSTDTDRWTRFWVSGTTAAGDNSLSLRLLFSEHQVLTCYVSALQLEQHTTYTYPTAWLAGLTSRGNLALAYPSAFVDTYDDGFTINCWIMSPVAPAFPSAMGIYVRSLLESFLQTDGTVLFRLFGPPSTGYPSAFVVTSSSTVSTSWRMVTFTFDRRAQTARLYVDGVLESTDVGSGTRKWESSDPTIPTDNIQVGYSGGGSFGAYLAHLSILPYVASLSLIQGWAGLPTPLATDPPLSFFPLTCSGDFLGSNEEYIQAFGEVTDVENISAAIPPASPGPGVWNDNLKKVKFILTEA